MQRTTTRFLIVLLFPFLYSCASKEDATVRETAQPTPPTAEIAHGSVTASIDGSAWQSGSAISKDMTDAIATVDPKTGYVTIRGTKSEVTASTAATGSDIEVIEITLKSAQPGSYTLSADFNNVQTATFSIGTDTSQVYFIHEKQSGEATIAQSDSAGHQLSGTFSFDASNAAGKAIHVTGGTFDVPIKQ